MNLLHLPYMGFFICQSFLEDSVLLPLSVQLKHRQDLIFLFLHEITWTVLFGVQSSIAGL